MAQMAAAARNPSYLTPNRSLWRESVLANPLLSLPDKVRALVTVSLPDVLVVQAGTSSVGRRPRGRKAPHSQSLRQAIEGYDRRLRDEAGISEEIRGVVVRWLSSTVGVRATSLPTDVSSGWDGAALSAAVCRSRIPDPRAATVPLRWLRDTLAAQSNGNVLVSYPTVAAHSEGYARRALALSGDADGIRVLKSSVTGVLVTRWGLGKEQALASLMAWDAVIGLTGTSQAELASKRRPIRRKVTETRDTAPPVSQFTDVRGGETPQSPGNPPPAGITRGNLDAPALSVGPQFAEPTTAPSISGLPPAVAGTVSSGQQLDPGLPSRHPLDDRSEDIGAWDPAAKVLPSNTATWDRVIPSREAVPNLPLPWIAAVLGVLTFGFGYTFYWLWTTWPAAYADTEKRPSRLASTVAGVIPVVGLPVVLGRARKLERLCATRSSGSEPRAFLQAALYASFTTLIATDNLWFELAGLACAGVMAGLGARTALVARRALEITTPQRWLPVAVAYVVFTTWCTLVGAHIMLP